MPERSNSLEAILQLPQEREKGFDKPQIVIAIFFFKEYRGGNWRPINYTSPAVKVHYAFSDILGEAASLVSRACHIVTLQRDLVRSPSQQQLFYLLGSMSSLRYVL
jgi:hypothetical protein